MKYVFKIVASFMLTVLFFLAPQQSVKAMTFAPSDTRSTGATGFGFPSGVSMNLPVDEIKNNITTALNESIAALGQLPAQIDANNQLTDEQKMQVKERVQQAGTLLNDLAGKVQNAQNTDDFLKILQDFLNQAQNNTSGYQTASVQSMQSMVNNLKLQGADISQTQTTLDQLKTSLAQQQATTAQLTGNIAKADSLDQAKQALTLWKNTKNSTQASSAIAQKWQELRQKILQLKTSYPSLFPTRSPSGYPPKTDPSDYITLPAVTRKPSIVYPSGGMTRPVNPTCSKRPPCLDSPNARCLMPEPIEGWCPQVTALPTDQVCAQVITSAVNTTTGQCKEFPTSCIPTGWTRVSNCSQI